MQSGLQSPLQRIVYLLVCAETDFVQRVVLACNGRVLGNTLHERRRYRLDGQQLVFVDGFGKDNARLNFDPDTMGFASADRYGVHLIPLLKLGAAADPFYNARLLVNTVPKSGTYLLDLILAELGFNRLGLHLISNECHDNRNVPPSEFHRDPYARRIFVPAHMVAMVMAPGEFAVGHVSDLDEARKLAQTGVRSINCYRNLRNVMVSYYRFKCKSVDPNGAADKLWRDLPEPQRFLGFLSHEGDRAIADAGTFSRLMHEFPGVHLRFEDLIAGVIPADAQITLNQFEPNLGTLMAEILPACLGRESSTLSSSLSEWEEYWSPEAEKFFGESGLREINQALGYE